MSPARVHELLPSFGDIRRYNREEDSLEDVIGDDMRKDYFGLYDPHSAGHMGYNWRQTIWHAAKPSEGNAVTVLYVASCSESTRRNYTSRRMEGALTARQARAVTSTKTVLISVAASPALG